MIDSKDRYHKEALKINDYLEKSNECTVINTTVLVETLNWSNGTYHEVNNIFDSLMDNNEFISLTDADYQKSLEINRWYGNSVNFSDCTIIKTMMDLRITQIVSFDNDFKNAGFTTISGVRGDFNGFHYEIMNVKLKRLVEKKALELNMSVDDLIWGYINRGLLDDGLGSHVFEKMHSEKFLKQINDALDVD